MENKNMVLTVGIILLVIIASVIMLAVTKKEEKVEENMLNINFEVEGNEATLDYQTENPVVALYIEGYGAVVAELYPSIAPNTVNNFISLVKSGFYDNNTFHRLMERFVLQGGDPTGTGQGGPGYHIKGEFTSNGFKNDLKHTEGILSMARGPKPDSAGSQFFIVYGLAQHLDGDYAAFGKVIDGMDTVKLIEKMEHVTNIETGKLAKNLVLKKALVDTKGKTYPEPEKIED